MENRIDQCPLCGSELSTTKFREIESRLASEKRSNADAVATAVAASRANSEAQFEQQMQKVKAAAETRANAKAAEDMRKLAAERDGVAKKLKEAETRNQEAQAKADRELARQKDMVERRVKADAAEHIKKLTSENDRNAKLLREAEERAEQSVRRTKEEAEKRKQKELADQRQILEQANRLSLLKKDSENRKETESLQKKLHVLQGQLEKKTANELGDGAEIDLFEELREHFPDDRITRVPKGQNGADIVHEVLYKGVPCGKIIVDSKNRQSWQNNFVTKLRQDRVAADAQHAILATTVFPSGKKVVCIESDVIVISPAYVTHITQLLRQAIVSLHVKGLSNKERSSKMAKLYTLISSDAYARQFAEAEQLAQDLKEVDVKEIKAHGDVWKKRGALMTRLSGVLGGVHADVAAVIEGQDDDQQVPPAFGARSVGSGGVTSTAEGKVSWTNH